MKASFRQLVSHSQAITPKLNLYIPGYRDASAKAKGLMSLLDRLPDEHFETLRMLMLHLHRYARQR